MAQLHRALYIGVWRVTTPTGGLADRVVDTTEQTPLTSDLRQAPQQELFKTTRLFDLAEHQFDHLFS